MRAWVTRPLLVLCLSVAGLTAAQNPAPVITVDHGANAAEQQAKPYVVMVSLDGFRYDYVSKYHAAHLQALGALGASAPEGMIPAYPSLTFPNHYTLVTGLYPGHHGIIGNSFYDPVRKQRYATSDPKAVTDGTWYGGTPLWSLAEQQGMRSACFFWPGSEAEIAGQRPTYYLKFDDHFPDDQRIAQVLYWLHLPPAQRPHLITLYYSNVDHAGHDFGPDSDQTAAAVAHVDELVGKLWEQLKQLAQPIDLIVVADHGMEAEKGPWINLDQYADLARVTAVGPLLYPETDAEAERIYQALKIKSDAFMVYRRSQLPSAYHLYANPRAGDPEIVYTGPYEARVHAPAAGAVDKPPLKGVHGFDPRVVPSMRALFVAVGPDVRPGVTLRPFENVNVYPLVAHLLGLKAPAVDGNLDVLGKLLIHPPAVEESR